IKSFQLRLPTIKVALVQFLLSMLSWSSGAAIIYILLGHEFRFDYVLFLALIAAIAGVVAHVPGGIGVIEFVFLTAIGKKIGSEKVVAVLLIYRLVYYLLPLVPALIN